MKGSQILSWLKYCDYPYGKNDTDMSEMTINYIDNLKSENTKLKKIIAQSPNENDDLGSEFTHVQILKDELDKAKNRIEILLGRMKACGNHKLSLIDSKDWTNEMLEGR